MKGVLISLIMMVWVFLSMQVMGQEIRITAVRLAGEDVEITYDLIDENPDHSYSISLYTSQDNYIQPMEQVDGDVGIDIPVGGNRKLVWHAREELGEDPGQAIALELKGNLYIPFITIEGIEEGMVFKRGVPNDLVWSGGRGDNVLNFELYKGENLVRSFEERPNIGNTSLVIPTNVRPGSNYRLRISDSSNRDEVVYTESFTIKRKIPLGAKIGASVVAGALIGYLIATLQPDVEPEIELPPLPTRE